MTEAVPVETPLADLEERSVGLALSAPLSARLDALVGLVVESGDRTSRKELIAALILAAEPNGEDLAGLVRAFRKALTRDTLVDSECVTEVSQERHKPGPRRRRPA